MAMTTSSSISVNARHGFMPDKAPPIAVQFKSFYGEGGQDCDTNHFYRLLFMS